MWTTEDDDKFAEAFRDVFDGLRLASAGKSDQRGTREVTGSMSQGNVASACTHVAIMPISWFHDAVKWRVIIIDYILPKRNAKQAANSKNRVKGKSTSNPVSVAFSCLSRTAVSPFRDFQLAIYNYLTSSVTDDRPHLALPSRCTKLYYFTQRQNSCVCKQLPRVVIWSRHSKKSNPQTLDCKSDARTITPPSHTVYVANSNVLIRFLCSFEITDRWC